MTKAIRAVATVCAIVVGVTLYAYTALQLFWDEHGDSVLATCRGLLDGLLEAYDVTCDLCNDVREGYNNVVKPWCARSVDGLFYTLIDV